MKNIFVLKTQLPEVSWLVVLKGTMIVFDVIYLTKKEISTSHLGFISAKHPDFPKKMASEVVFPLKS